MYVCMYYGPSLARGSQIIITQFEKFQWLDRARPWVSSGPIKNIEIEARQSLKKEKFKEVLKDLVKLKAFVD